MTCHDQYPDVSGIISKQIALHPETFCVDDLMDEMYSYTIGKLEYLGKSHVDAEILKYSDFDKCRICADRLRLRQIFENLLDFSINSTEKGYIFFGYHTSNTGEVDFFVEDTGRGIPEKQLPLPFGQFNRDERDGKYHGLFVSQGLVQLMGGEFEIESSEDAGTSLEFSISCNPCEFVV